MNPLIQITFFGYPSNIFWASEISTMNFTSVKTDGYDNVYISAWQNDAAITPNVQLINYDSYGSIVWQRSVGSAVGDIPGEIEIDSSKNIYISARTTDNPSSTYVAASLKYNSSGVLQWQRRLTGYTGGTASTGIAVDSSGNSYYCGYTDITSPSNYQVIFYKRNSSGTLQFNRIYGTTSSPGGQDFSSRVSLDSSGSNAYVLSTTFVGSSRAYVAKYNSSGTLLWQKYLPGSAYGMYVDNNDYLYISGSDGTNPYVLKADSAATIQWARKLNFTGTNYAVDVSSTGDVYSASLYNSGSRTVMTKHNSSGTLQWQREIIYSGKLIAPNDIKLDLRGNIYCCMDASGGSPTFRGVLVKLPQDGSRTGTFGNYTISQSSHTDSSASISFTDNFLGDSAASMTEAANNWTDSAGSNSPTFTQL